MTKKLGPWTTDPGGEVRFADPHDGRTWDLDGSPRWIAEVHSCCGAPLKEPETLHFVWGLGDKDPGHWPEGRRPGGSEKTREEAKAKADTALKERGWEL